MKNQMNYLKDKWRKIGRIIFIFSKIKEKVLSLKISIKFILFYLILLVVSISLSNYFFQKINAQILESKIGDASVQTLDAISSGIDSMFDNINNYSKMILSNNDIQAYLLHNKEYPDYEATREVTELLAGYLQAMPNISSIYLFDNNSKMYAVDPHLKTNKRVKIENIKQASWYDEAVGKKGKYIIKVNAGGIFENDEDENYVSFIRMINDIQNNKPIGFMIINIPAASLKATFEKTISGNDVYIAAVYNEFTIIDFENLSFHLQDIDDNLINKKHEATLMNLDQQPYLVSSVISEKSNWRLVSVTPLSELKSEYNQIDFIAFFIILLNGVFLFIGALFISRFITVPINKILESMKMVEKGELLEVQISSGNDEIGRLRDGYNEMVIQIRELINKIIREQKMKRKTELNMLQEQIKPHFLYNSLDVIAYMIVTGNGSDAYNVIIALSNYYRTCLSKGSEVITIAEELDIVRNYLKIQEVRFPNQFTAKYEIDESIGDVKILKFILQPLVENALYHGIRPKGESGEITIRVKKEDEWVRLSIEDDGVGMNEEELHKVLGTELRANLSSFGLRGTIERLKIFCESDDVYTIWSEKGQGTVISITIPLK